MAKSNLCQAYNYGSAKKNFRHYNQVGAYGFFVDNAQRVKGCVLL